MDLSIVIPTINRDVELDQLLNSLIKPIQLDFEILIVDQNSNNLIDTVVAKYKSLLPITHIKVDFKGLSKAKNYGVSHSKGEIVCFPDDDSEFLSDTIEKALTTIQKYKDIDILFGKTEDRTGNDSVIKFSTEPGFLTLSNFEGKFVEATMFARRELMLEFEFDENLGAGRFFGAEEGFDLIYRLLKAKKNLFYDTKIRFYHPQTSLNKNNYDSLLRVHNYRKGFSYTCLKHNLYLRFFSRVAKVLFGAFVFLIFNKTKSYYYFVELNSLLGGALLSNKFFKRS